ncbi:MAG: hypothetical protein OXD40_00305 [bacterium]|nr:hypothetical protein [bacterium]
MYPPLKLFTDADSTLMQELEVTLLRQAQAIHIIERARVTDQSHRVSDENWERIKARANCAGMTISAYLEDSALAVDPGRPAITLALTHDDQQVLLMLVESIHAQHYQNRGEDPSIRDKIHNSTSFLARQKMKDMIRDGHSEELHTTLALMLGKDEAARIVKALVV